MAQRYDIAAYLPVLRMPNGAEGALALESENTRDEFGAILWNANYAYADGISPLRVRLSDSASAESMDLHTNKCVRATLCKVGNACQNCAKICAYPAPFSRD